MPKTEQKPANLVFLIDVSGSMSSTAKLPLALTLLKEAVGVLAPEDTVSIVTYASNTRVALGPTPVSQASAIYKVIDGLSAGGSTAGAGGLDLAYAQAQAGFKEGGINHVLLCTDGDFNVGPSSDSALLALIEKKRESGITLTVLGFGMGNLNDSMMEAISNAGNGVYAVIVNTDQAIRYANERLLSDVHYIAQDVKFQVHFNPDHVRAYRLLGYENRAIADDDFTNDKVDAGEIGANLRVTALYELVMADGEIPEPITAPAPVDGPEYSGDLGVEPGELCRVKIRYKDVGATANDAAHEIQYALVPAMVRSSFDAASADFKWAAAVAAFAEILKDSPYGKQANLSKISGIINTSTGSDADRAEFKLLLGQASSMLLGYR